MVDTQDYENFFTIVKKFQEEQKKQKQRGLNDYNMVNVVRKENAEVGMHSNVIYSLINPNGLHYQEDLFLKLFIQEVLKINDFGEVISVNAEELTFENRRIDFTIKSSNYYVGIEMKIDASDLENQLSHYNEDLLKKAKDDNIENVMIYYLTKDGKEAAGHSSNEIEYKKISFKEDILNWIEKCQAEVRNITNLNEAFENYKDIVKKITNQYKGKVMQLEGYLEVENIKDIKEILDEIDEMQERVSSKFIYTLDEYLGAIEGKYKNGGIIDIPIGEYMIRLIFNTCNNILLLQIGDKENSFKSVSSERKGVFKDKYLTKIEQEGIDLGKLDWLNGYGDINLGKVRFQTLDHILKKAKTITSKLSTILRNQ